MPLILDVRNGASFGIGNHVAPTSDVSANAYLAGMPTPRTYSSEDLKTAIADSASWRGVLRTLGLLSTSSGAMLSVRQRADTLGISCAHFRGQRRWSDAQLREAVAKGNTWPDVRNRLGLAGTRDLAAIKGHALRLGLETRHLEPILRTPNVRTMNSPLDNLDRAGSLLAASWFTLCGFDVAWPLEPCRYDLIVSMESEARRVQVKTTTTRVGNTWKAYLSTSGETRRLYDPDEIDDFFVVDGDMNFYFIPVAAVGGLYAIHLRAYDEYRVEK